MRRSAPAQPGGEVLVIKGAQAFGPPILAQDPERGQRHAVEGVVLAGGIDGHIAEQQQVALPQRGGKAVIPDDVPGQAGRAAQTEQNALRVRLARASRMAFCVALFCTMSSTRAAR